MLVAVRAGAKWVSLRFRAFFLALYRTVRASAERVMSEDKNFQRIELTDSDYDLCLNFPRPRFQLNSRLGEVTTVDLSLEEARALFGFIAYACEKQNIFRAKIGHMSVRINAQPNPKHPDRLRVRFGQPLGLWTDLSRQRVMAAHEEFSTIFGETSTRLDDGNFDDS
ncbi:MAG: hypothetical protein IJ935_18110 [Afipia sp.]|nr:hypothetical protein [Afipia sp.]